MSRRSFLRVARILYGQLMRGELAKLGIDEVRAYLASNHSELTPINVRRAEFAVVGEIVTLTTADGVIRLMGGPCGQEEDD